MDGRTAEGLFEPGSVTRRVNREAVLILAGGRALLMQLAHPLVAAGVAEHSDFRADPLGRLRRTLDAMLSVVFGGPECAGAAVRRVAAVHARVRGVLRESAGAYPAGTRYDARDPKLMLWVHATLVDSALVGYQRFVAPLRRGERALFYAESKRVAGAFGLPDRLLPASLADFEHYLAGMLDGDELAVTPMARRLAEAVLRPGPPGVPRLVGVPAGVASALTLDLLPAPLRERYGFAWSPRRALAAGVATRAIRRARPLLPPVVRLWPHARHAERRSR